MVRIQSRSRDESLYLQAFLIMPSCYILHSSKLDKYYVGSTNDIIRRLADHNRGKEKFTKTGCPWILVYKEDFARLTEARNRERIIKKQKSKKYIQNLKRYPEISQNLINLYDE